MMPRNLTLYVNDSDRKTVVDAKRYLAFHEGKSLSQLVIEMCGEIVKRYESNVGKSDDK
jgi:hypothetical protein